MVKEILALMLGVFVFFVSIAMCFEVQYIHEENMAKLGYEEDTIEGEEGTVWRKIR